ncbi:MAG: hypothetical protein ACRC8A_19980 [Microcoleaceae cyanobacterium]
MKTKLLHYSFCLSSSLALLATAHPGLAEELVNLPSKDRHFLTQTSAFKGQPCQQDHSYGYGRSPLNPSYPAQSDDELVPPRR